MLPDRYRIVTALQIVAALVSMAGAVGAAVLQDWATTTLYAVLGLNQAVVAAMVWDRRP